MIHLLEPLSLLGVGSVPFIEGQESTNSIFQKYDIPFWPQYPSRSAAENFVFQFLSSFPGLERNGPQFFFNEAKYHDQSRNFRDRLNRAFAEQNFLDFEPPPEWAMGYSQLKYLLAENRFPEKRIIKLQITGPNTVWKSFFSSVVSPSSRHTVFKDICDTLIVTGLAQIQRISAYGRTPLIFIDEPLLSDGNSEELKEMIRGFKEFGALAGLHVCSNLEWKIFESLEIDVFHFDFISAYPSLTSFHASFLSELLKKEVWVAWGVAPTNPKFELKSNNFSSITQNWWEKFLSNALPIEKVCSRSLLAPACGTGNLSPAQDEWVWQSLIAAGSGLSSMKKTQKKALDTI